MVLEFNTALALGHFQNYWVVQPSLYFWRALEIEFLENTIGVELEDNGRPKRTFKLHIHAPCEKIIVKHHCGVWGLSKKSKK